MNSEFLSSLFSLLNLLTQRRATGTVAPKTLEICAHRCRSIPSLPRKRESGFFGPTHFNKRLDFGFCRNDAVARLFLRSFSLQVSKFLNWSDLTL